ncbi:hypothetical protein HA402_011951, partial [Bradysia odoriphaga]
DDNYEFVKLGTPIHFYSETYDHLYVNTNGIITFGVEFPHFVNLPFPLEYPAIAPFYSNIDTTDANVTSSISYFKSYDPEILNKATNYVKLAFDEAYDFQATSVFVATWANVGHYQAKNDVGNTFQVAIISDEIESYAQYLYPTNGLNWIQGDIGESGLPDVRAQAGFVSEDGRFYSLKGSGTDKANYLSELTNCGDPGSWLFRIGPLGVEPNSNVQEPDYGSINESEVGVPTCASLGRLKCHSSATCVDTSKGFCCKCNNGFYGNGYSCLKDDVPVRVSGKVVGKLNDISISSQLQSYVVMADGRSYTALSPLTPNIGYNMQLLQVLGGTIGWLFAKLNGDVKNGYQITGGKFNHTTTIRFDGTNHHCFITQRFVGLNAWDQLSVDIEISGTIPEIPNNVPVQINDITEEYNYNTETSVRSIGTRRVSVNDQEYVLNVDQEIDFEKCEMSEEESYTNHPPFYNKVSKISSSYQSRESALRIGMLNKIVANLETNPCTDGTAQCGQNTICVVDGEDGYECNCKNGFTLTPYASYDGVQNCVDIDECSSINICDANADCFNDPGGYSCRCRDGFTGNGYACEPVASNLHSSESTVQPDPTLTTPEHYQCDQCSDRANCLNGVCVCAEGYTGDGIVCTYNCPNEYVWNGDTCMPAVSDEDEAEVAPFCEITGCTCPTGYELIEYAVGQTCRALPAEDTENDRESEGLPCDIENNCSPYAQCEWVESELRNKCVCNPQYEGNGYVCTEVEVSCIYENICHARASCSYDEKLGKSICRCEAGWEGDGRHCSPAPECRSDEQCGNNAVCEYGVCACQQGFERDISNFCVPGSCGGAICAENAECQLDPLEQISYCSCPSGYEGDGIVSCKEITPPCNIRNNCGYYASCAPNYRNTSIYECVCDVGYTGDGFTCELEINCQNQPSLCSENAQCVPTSAGLQCVCQVGFIGNGSVCSKPPSLESGFLLLSQGVATVRIPFDGKRGQPVSMSNMAIGLDKDCSQGRVYWSDISNKQIVSVKYDGTDRQIFIKDDILSPEGIAVDWINRRLYWTDSTKDTIEVASLDDPKLRTVVVRKHLVNPRGLAVDPHQNKLYWSDWNRDGPKIEWSNLDGTEREILLTDPDVKLPNSLAISQSTGELCFADAGTKKVECIDTYSPRAVRTIAANLSYPFGLTVTDDQFYWTDWTTKKIESVDHQGNRLTPISSPLFGNHKMYGITAVVEKCPLFYSPCQVNNGDCKSDRICLVNTRSPSGKACKCLDESRSCSETPSDY